jgi:galactokinase
LLLAFRQRFGGEPRVFSAPGRVNLIGEHTDYNDGFVLPMAIERRTRVAAAPRADRTVRVYSREVDRTAVFDLGRPGPPRRGDFVDYLEGTAQGLEDRGIALHGADVIVESEVPLGAGLASSAALEVALGLALATLAGTAVVDRMDLALAGQEAEQRYVGTNSGIMDQFVAAFGKADCALLIDCRERSYRTVDLALPGAAVVVCHTGVAHAHASSAYNQRRNECVAGLEILRRALPELRALRDVGAADLSEHEGRLPEPLRARCRHVVSENARTLRAADALAQGDLAEVGRLMFASHASLRTDYAVSCPELDRCVEIAASVPGVYGARLTGGGFGGSTVNLVAVEAVPVLAEALRRGFVQSFGREPDVFVSRASYGACEHAGS